jgi:hypothetical protein
MNAIPIREWCFAFQLFSPKHPLSYLLHSPSHVLEGSSYLLEGISDVLAGATYVKDRKVDVFNKPANAQQQLTHPKLHE